MKVRILVFFFTILFIASLSACNKKEKYDKQINQVITLEKAYLHNEKNIKNTKKVNRSNMIIAVYKNGKYINLIYEINKDEKIDCFNKKTKDLKFIRYLNTDKEIEKAKNDLKEADYIENTSKK